MKTEPKSAHTPGPWKYMAGCIWGEKRLVADLEMNTAPREEIEANARLIAAAPDLKLQNEINMDFLIELIDQFPIESGARAEIEERIEKTRAAIAKAEGK